MESWKIQLAFQKALRVLYYSGTTVYITDSQFDYLETALRTKLISDCPDHPYLNCVGAPQQLDPLVCLCCLFIEVYTDRLNNWSKFTQAQKDQNTNLFGSLHVCLETSLEECKVV